ncbi:hypothetical protein FJ366_04195 [Candidatus Dependentiae bacterium]|nr:hypothetical protein [Candidatus Dependentiae bacterium]
MFKKIIFLFFGFIFFLNPVKAESFDQFKTTWEERSISQNEKTPAEKTQFLLLLTYCVIGLEKAKDLSDEIKISKNFILEPGIALSSEEIDQRIAFLKEKITLLATEWGLPEPESLARRELTSLSSR